MDDFKRTVSLINKNKTALFTFEVLFIAAYAAVMVPLLDILFRWSLKLAGISFITFENLKKYFTQPFTIFMLAAVLLVTGIFAAADTIFLSMLFYMGRDEKVSFERVFYPAIKRYFFVITHKNNLGLFLQNIFLGILMLMPVIIKVFFNERMIRYMSGEILESPSAVIIAAVLFIIVVILIFLGMFVNQIVCFEGKDYKEAYNLSILLVKNNFKQMVKQVAVCNTIFISAYGILYVIVTVAGCFVMYITLDKSVVIAGCMSFITELDVYVGIMAVALSVILNIALVSGAYVRLRENEALEGCRRLKLDKITGQDRNLIMQSPSGDAGEYAHIVRFLLIFVIASNVAIFINSFMNGSAVLNNEISDIRVTAHRGASFDAPENTIPALETAINMLADYAEIDVQETEDGIVVLLHDKSLARTTGISENIWEVTYIELINYDASYGFREYAGTGIPAFEEVLKVAKGRIRLNIELKVTAHEQNLIEKVVRYIEKYEFEDQCTITSTSYQALVRVKELNSDIKTGYIISLAYGNLYDVEAADFFSMKSTFINEDTVKMAHSFGKEIHAWTVNTKTEAIRMINIGVDNIITDKPVMVRELIYSETEPELFEILNMVFGR